MTSISHTLKQFVVRGLGRYFEAKYAEWVDSSKATQDVHQRLAARIAGTAGVGTILDIGSGPGHLAIELARLLPKASVCGLDMSPSMIEMAERNVAEADISHRVAFRQGDAALLPFADCAFDFVVSSWSLHLWEEPAQAFSEIHRVLRSGGSALVYDARKHPPAKEARRWTRTANSVVMRFGLLHSFNEGFTAEDIRAIVADIPFGKVGIHEEGADLEIWLEKQEA
jgi:ubiquinone/menaquinone biosynthesis C-methylase UbiE